MDDIIVCNIFFLELSKIIVNLLEKLYLHTLQTLDTESTLIYNTYWQGISVKMCID